MIKKAGATPGAYKKGILLVLFLFLTGPLMPETEYGLRFLAEYSFPIQDDLILPGPGGTLIFDISPFPWLNLFAQGEYLLLPMDNIKPASLIEGALGAGYENRLTERISVGVDITLGVYMVSVNDQSLSGISSGLRGYSRFKITPDQSVLIHGGVKTHLSQPRSFMDSFTLGVGYKLNLSEVIRNIAHLNVEPESYSPIFPVFYTWYNENTFAAVKITNNEENTIKDVQTSFFLEQYMEQPYLCSRIDSLAPGESALIPLTALFNEDMLELTENINTRAQVSVAYTSLGKEKQDDLTLPVPIYHRNAMTWTDDRRAAAFVSSRDPAALWFSKYVAGVVRDQFRMGINNNMQYAMGILETLNIYGINYVIDPTSVYSEMSSSDAIDFLQYPYQTLMYRGGDCDDLSILICSLLEAIGIDTAFITIPGHIFMAFSLGMTEDEARKDFYDPEQLIYHNDQAWVPLESTLSQEGFIKAWKVGAKQWSDAHNRGEAMIYPLKDSWKIYPPVSIPGAVSRFKLPEKEKSTQAFEVSLDRYVEREIRPQIRILEDRIKVDDNDENRNSLGILYGRYGMLKEAGEQFRQVAEAQNIHGWTNLGNIAFLEADYKQGLLWFNKTLSVNPEDPVALLGMARCYYEMDDYSSSDYYYNQLIKYDRPLGKEYGYLNSFFDTTGRAWSFSERLTTTKWSKEKAAPREILPEFNKPVNEPESIEEPVPEKGLTTMLSFSEKVPALKPPDPVIEPQLDAEDEPEPVVLTPQPAEPEPVVLTPQPAEPEPEVLPPQPAKPEPEVLTPQPAEPEPEVLTLQPAEPEPEVLTPQPAEPVPEVLPLQPAETEPEVLTLQPAEPVPEVLTLPPEEKSGFGKIMVSLIVAAFFLISAGLFVKNGKLRNIFDRGKGENHEE